MVIGEGDRLTVRVKVRVSVSASMSVRAIGGG